MILLSVHIVLNVELEHSLQDEIGKTICMFRQIQGDKCIKRKVGK